MKWNTFVSIIVHSTVFLHAGELADVVRQARITGGIIVLVDGSDASYEDAAGTPCTVHGLETDGTRVPALRKRLLAEGTYGRISVSRFNGKTLPYIDNLANLVAIEAGRVPTAEAIRVLAPRGVLLVKADGAWSRSVKPVPDDIDEWNQYLHDADNNAVAADRVGPPSRMQWVGGTRWGRSHMSWVTVTSMLSAGGRLYTIEDLASAEYHVLPANFHLIARDAFNGCELWRQPLREWHKTRSYVKFVPVQIQRRLAAIGDKVYCTLGLEQPITVLDGATGAVLTTFSGTAGTREFVFDRDMLYVTVGDAYDPPKSRDVDVVLKALDVNSGRIVWHR